MFRKIIAFIMSCFLVISGLNLIGCSENGTASTELEKDEKSEGIYSKMSQRVNEVSEYVGALTLFSSNRGMLVLSNGEKQEYVEERAISIDPSSKRGFVKEYVKEEGEEYLASEKFYANEGQYFSTSLRSDKDGVISKKHAKIDVEDVFAKPTLFIGSEFANADFVLLQNIFSTNTFAELKDHYTCLYQESLSSQKAEMKRINDVYDSQKNYISPSNPDYNKLCAEIDAKKKIINKVKAEVSLSIREENEEQILTLDSKLCTESIYEEFVYCEMEMDYTITFSRDKMEVLIECDGVREKDGDRTQFQYKTLSKITYSFNEDDFAQLPNCEDEKSIEIEHKNVVFNYVINGETISKNKVLELSNADSVAQVIELVIDGDFAGSIQNYGVYTDVECANSIDLASLSVRDLELIDNLYIKVTLGEGYSVVYYEQPESVNCLNLKMSKTPYFYLSRVGALYVDIRQLEVVRVIGDSESYDLATLSIQLINPIAAKDVQFDVVYNVNGQKITSELIQITAGNIYTVETKVDFEKTVFENSVFQLFYNFHLY